MAAESDFNVSGKKRCYLDNAEEKFHVSSSKMSKDSESQAAITPPTSAAGCGCLSSTPTTFLESVKSAVTCLDPESQKDILLSPILAGAQADFMDSSSAMCAGEAVFGDKLYQHASCASQTFGNSYKWVRLIINGICFQSLSLSLSVIGLAVSLNSFTLAS